MATHSLVIGILGDSRPDSWPSAQPLRVTCSPLSDNQDHLDRGSVILDPRLVDPFSHGASHSFYGILRDSDSFRFRSDSIFMTFTLIIINNESNISIYIYIIYKYIFTCIANKDYISES